ncbi:MAG: efflux RND transporter permease subunit [Magnetospirillum sp. WYHS-4]
MTVGWTTTVTPPCEEAFQDAAQGLGDRQAPGGTERLFGDAVEQIGLLPIMWSTGTGSEVMRRIAVPMVGGTVSSTVLTLVVIPALYALIKEFAMRSALAPASVEIAESASSES